MPSPAGKSSAAKASKGKKAGAAASTSAAATSSEDVKIHGRVSVAQVEKACAALAAHREKTKNEAHVNGQRGDNEADEACSRANPADTVWLQVTVKALSATAPPKAVRIPVPHPIYPQNASICLLTADPQRTYKDIMVADKITQVQRVVGVTKLKGKFAPHEARRQLMSDHDVFLADDRIIPMLPKLLGKKWMQDRKSPIPVKLTRTNDGRVKRQVEVAMAATYFYRNKGTCSSIRIGTLNHLAPEQMAENVAAALPKIVGEHIKGHWENIQSIDIKTGTSAALPVWNIKMSERWTGLPEPKQRSEATSGSEDEEEESQAKTARNPAVTKTKSNKDDGKVRSSANARLAKPVKATGAKAKSIPKRKA